MFRRDERRMGRVVRKAVRDGNLESRRRGSSSVEDDLSDMLEDMLGSPLLLGSAAVIAALWLADRYLGWTTLPWLWSHFLLLVRMIADALP